MKRILYLALPVLLAGLFIFTTFSNLGSANAKGLVIQTESTSTLGTGFSYQGRLTQNGSQVTGTCDFQFAFFDALSGGSMIGGGTNRFNTPVTDGLFSVTLNQGGIFGADAFDGSPRWLAINVRCPAGGGAFTNLSPRQEILAAPYALYSEEAGSASTAPWSGLSGVPAGFADGRDGVEYSNVVAVAKSGGDFTSVQAAIDSITDAAGDNPYLVWVAPGVYSETVQMKPFVHLQGAGQDATVITSTVEGATTGTLSLVSDTSLRDLMIRNGGSGSVNIALWISSGVTPTMVADITATAQGNGASNRAVQISGPGTQINFQNIYALAENGSSTNFGISVTNNAEVTLRGGTYIARGGATSLGIANSSGSLLEGENILVLGENGSTVNYGFRNEGNANATLVGGSFSGKGGMSTYGLFNTGISTTLETNNVTALGVEGSDTNIGLKNEITGTAKLIGGSFSGAGGNLYNSGLDISSGILHIIGGTFTGNGGQSAVGIAKSNGTLIAQGISALGKNGSLVNIGLSDLSDLTIISQSVLEGGTYSLNRVNLPAIMLSNSRLVGGPASTYVLCMLVSRGTAISSGTFACP